MTIDSTAAPARRRVLIDVSDLRAWRNENKHLTGIQRTVAEIAGRLVADPNIDVQAFFWDASSDDFFYEDASILEPERREVGDDELQFERIALLMRARRAGEGAARAMWHRAWPIRRRLLRIESARKTYRRLRRSYASMQGRRSVVFESTDLVLVLGSAWLPVTLAPALAERRRRHDFELATLIYDIIPVDYPHLYTQDMAETFARFLKVILPASSTVFTISEASKKAIQGFADRNGIRVAAPKILYLGEDFVVPGEVRRPAELPDGDYVLAVSTFEARKNYQILYEALKLANERGLDLPRIVVVGRDGFRSGDLGSIIEQDVSIRGRFIRLRGMSDAELAWLYQNALFTVYPSIVEGWGLPIAESIFFGKFCISSPTSSMPEIAGDLIDYVSPFDSAGWAAAIHRYATDRELLAERVERLLREYEPRKWGNAANALRGALDLPAA